MTGIKHQILEMLVVLGVNGRKICKIKLYKSSYCHLIFHLIQGKLLTKPEGSAKTMCSGRLLAAAVAALHH